MDKSVSSLKERNEERGSAREARARAREPGREPGRGREKEKKEEERAPDFYRSSGVHLKRREKGRKSGEGPPPPKQQLFDDNDKPTRPIFTAKHDDNSLAVWCVHDDR
ncbi:hypothetical protein ACJ72_00703 [Emergomyces africanus]|uniref:Uncharacterized protein n=1 Tax=Emergomyces africanus TaxID=1955775 RepID=A0A1B7P7P6_9EURO|nr:hypothetical protein ACJ72_00703 [Emergomyces africanus]